MRIKNIPEDLHKRFRILCIQESVSLNEKIIQLMKEAVEKGKPPK